MIDTAGCIIVAEHFGKLGEDRAVLNSGVTFAKFMRRLEGFSRCHLTVIEVY